MKSILILSTFLIFTSACAPYVASNEDNNRPGNKPGGNPPNTQLALADEPLQISTALVTIENSFEVDIKKEIQQVTKNYYYTMIDADAKFVLQDFDPDLNTSNCRAYDNHLFITDGYEYMAEIRNSEVILLKKHRTYRLQLIMDNLSCTKIKSRFVFRKL